MKLLSIAVLCCLIAAAPAGAVVLVDTDFEADSAGAGTWTTGSNWIGQTDPGSGDTYAQTGNGVAQVVAGVGQPEGSQAGMYNSTSGIGGVNLYYGDDTQTGIYKITHSSKIVNDPSHTSVRIPVLRFGDESTNKYAFATRLVSYGDGEAKVQFQHTNTSTYWNAIERSADVIDTWYDFEYIVDMPNKTVDIKVKESGASTWAATLLGVGFVYAADVSSLDQFKAYADNAGVDLYLDNLVVEQIPEPATMILLGLGGLLIRRRK